MKNHDIKNTKKIIKLIKKELDINRDINIEKTFEENNIDSLDKFTIISYIEKKIKLKSLINYSLKLKHRKICLNTLSKTMR